MVKGPYPLLCRGHSGGRLVCEAFIRNGIAMGQVNAERKDTDFFAITNPRIREIILNAYQYLQATHEQQVYYQDLMRCCVEEYQQREIPPAGPFGWKMGITLFAMLVVLDAFPAAKVIHLIRDGRDVMLSRLEARLGGLNFADPVNKLVVFGDINVDSFAGQPLTPTTIAAYRNELEMLHWVTAVRYGLQGRAYPDRYLEVKYEDICADPIAAFEQVFDFIEINFEAATQQWLLKTVHADKIGKWQTLAAEQLELPLRIGEALLRELGYISDG